VDTQSVVVAQQQEHNNSSTMTNNNNHERENIILSIGQFRPEKDHALQLHSFATFLTMYKKDKMDNDDDDIIQLVLIGSCRDDDDTHRVTQLRHLAKEINIEKHVKFVINQPYSVIIDYLHKSSVGLHTMWNEHFGIGIVEMMAAGLVTIAHNSGGPKMDIILDPWDYTKTTYQKSDRFPTGCLASTVDEYAACMYEIFSRINNKTKEEDDNIISRIRDEGRRSVTRFSDEEFMNTFKETLLSSILFESGSYTTTMTTYVLLVTVFVVLIAILLISLT
jgi:alpha-1,2-mannosyltransferase